MILRLSAGTGLLRPELQRLLADHGARRVALSLLVLLISPPRQRAEAPLSGHLRRDIGLPEVSPRSDYLRHL